MINDLQHTLDILGPIVVSPFLTMVVSFLKRWNINPMRVLLLMSFTLAAFYTWAKEVGWWEHLLTWGVQFASIAGVAVLIYEVLVKWFRKILAPKDLPVVISPNIDSKKLERDLMKAVKKHKK